MAPYLLLFAFDTAEDSLLFISTEGFLVGTAGWEGGPVLEKYFSGGQQYIASSFNKNEHISGRIPFSMAFLRVEQLSRLLHIQGSCPVLQTSSTPILREKHNYKVINVYYLSVYISWLFYFSFVLWIICKKSNIGVIYL